MRFFGGGALHSRIPSVSFALNAGGTPAVAECGDPDATADPSGCGAAELAATGRSPCPANRRPTPVCAARPGVSQRGGGHALGERVQGGNFTAQERGAAAFVASWAKGPAASVSGHAHPQAAGVCAEAARREAVPCQPPKLRTR